MMMSPTTGTLEFGDGQGTSNEQAFRVAEFGGHVVPDQGLVLSQPSGESLLVWPDGKYIFIGPEDDAGQAVITYYSYVLEDADGNMVSGTFSPGAALFLAKVEHEAQAWSLEDILALNDSILSAGEDGVSFDVSENNELALWSDADQDHPFFTAVHQGAEQEYIVHMLATLEPGGSGFSEDVLTKMLAFFSEG